VNCGGFGSIPSSSSSSSSLLFEPGTSLWAQRIACRVLRVHQSIFSGLDNDEEKDNKICGDVSAVTLKNIHDAIVVKDFSQAEIDAGIIDGFRSHCIKSGGNQHIRQIASLIGHLRQIGLFENRNKKEEDLVLLELGAGRGMFGLAAAGVACSSGLNTHFIMVDRAGSRAKADTAFRNIPENADTSYIKLDQVNWSRIRCDLSHVTLPVILNDDKYKEGKVVVIAKHLCGAGTDLALKSLEPIRHKVDACLIATCCHGICDYQQYVGRDVLRNIMEGKECDAVSFGPLEFDLLRRWSAATVATREARLKTCVHDTACLGDDDVEHKNVSVQNGAIDDSNKTSAINISSVVRQLNLSCGIQGLGRACQRLIDYGRSKYIQQQIFQNDDERTIVDLSHYVAADVTPQNAILFAYRKDKPK